MRLRWFRLCLLIFFAARLAYADGGPAFDLDGPRIQLKVTRSGKSLPIGEVASLAPGDRLWVHPDFPEHEAAHYLLWWLFSAVRLILLLTIGLSRQSPGIRRFAK